MQNNMLKIPLSGQKKPYKLLKKHKLSLAKPSSIWSLH